MNDLMITPITYGAATRHKNAHEATSINRLISRSCTTLSIVAPSPASNVQRLKASFLVKIVYVVKKTSKAELGTAINTLQWSSRRLASTKLNSYFPPLTRLFVFQSLSFGVCADHTPRREKHVKH